MREKFSRERDGMHEGVVEAKNWATWLVQRETRGPGDLPNAMRRLESRYGIPPGVFKALRYKQPEDILHSVYVSIRSAYLAELERTERAARHEANLVRAAIQTCSDIVGGSDS
jgi:hypothetical protein